MQNDILEQEVHLLQMFEARERDLKAEKDGQISELQVKIRQLENNGMSSNHVICMC